MITRKRRKEIYSNDGNLEKCKIHSISLIIQISIEYNMLNMRAISFVKDEPWFVRQIYRRGGVRGAYFFRRNEYDGQPAYLSFPETRKHLFPSGMAQGLTESVVTRRCTRLGIKDARHSVDSHAKSNNDGFPETPK